METNPIKTEFLSFADIASEIDPIGTPLLESTIERAVPCPYCRSTNTAFFSLFGRQLLTEQYYCNQCHTPFEHIKDEDTTLHPDK